MRRPLPIIFSLVILLAAGAAMYFFLRTTSSSTSSPNATSTPAAQIPVPALDATYADAKYKFSFKYPSSYSVHEDASVNDGSDTVLIQDPSGQGIQIFISPWTGSNISITPALIEQDIPGAVVNNPQVLDIGAGGSASQGLAFESNNPAFGGNSREAWFVYKGNLYQISTYEEYDDLLRAIFATWQFQ